MTILEQLGKSWHQKLGHLFLGIGALQSYIKKERALNKVCPEGGLIFEAFKQTPFEEVKIVILGKEPSILPGVSDGLAFSSKKPEYTTPELKNIYKEIERDIYGVNVGLYAPSDLKHWAKQGILLLNTSLTSKTNVENSHLGYWDNLIVEVISLLGARKDPIAFILLGDQARTYTMFIENQHLVLNTSYPSNSEASKGFFDSKVFSKSSDFVKEHYNIEIQWALDFSK